MLGTGLGKEGEIKHLSFDFTLVVYNVSTHLRLNVMLFLQTRLGNGHMEFTHISREYTWFCNSWYMGKWSVVRTCVFISVSV